MKLIKYILFIFLLAGNIAKAQNKFDNLIKKKNIDPELIKLIDKQKLDSIIQNSNSELTLVIIYTNYCAGTPHALSSVNETTRKFNNKVNIVLCSSAPYNEIKHIPQVLKDNEVEIKPVYMIDSDKYKDKKMDDRKKGYLFRNDICEECKNDIIGVPYKILFDNNKKIIAKGYPSRADMYSIIEDYFNSKK